ncbi:unnamed protein product [Ceutorhynchus assimilis]|uniref:Peptidase M14 domain-containing protein n=1 Tax=Ceutorhynchus assimilis TaxID=467358 RepID=A0A9N9QT63_9CUCU|nr:unnamed protein product [Ceutorhynchus assimilis]
MSIRRHDRKPTKPIIKKSKSKKTVAQKPKTPSQNPIVVEKLRLPCIRREEFHDSFLSYDKITDFLIKVQKDHPRSVNVESIGDSKEGKPIWIVQITSINSTESPKQVTFIEAGLNGEDIFAVSNCLHIVDHLSRNDNSVRTMDYFICPCGNPDAYDKFIETKIKKETSGETEKAQKKGNRRGSNKNCSKTMVFNKVNSNKVKGKEDPNETDEAKKHNNKNVDGLHCNKQQVDNFGIDLTNNFPVILGLSDMAKIKSHIFLEKIQVWKEHYIKDAPETVALLRTINHYQFAIKLLISLHDGGETISYPFGFTLEKDQESRDLQEVAKKGKCAMPCRNFQFGSYYDIRGMTYGILMDFLKIDKASIKYLYAIQVHAKTKKGNEKQEMKTLRANGVQMMQCIKRMSCSVYKLYTNMTGNKEVELVRTRPGIVRKKSL